MAGIQLTVDGEGGPCPTRQLERDELNTASAPEVELRTETVYSSGECWNVPLRRSNPVQFVEAPRTRYVNVTLYVNPPRLCDHVQEAGAESRKTSGGAPSLAPPAAGHAIEADRGDGPTHAQ